MRLQGKVAFITGGSRGIGAAIAERFGSEGAKVVLTYKSSASGADAVVEAVKSKGGEALAIQADSGDEAAVRGAVRRTAATYGKVDILVNNAMIGTAGRIEDVTSEDFHGALAVGLRGVFAATQEALLHMGRGGRIIMIGSTMGDVANFEGASIYAMVKGGMASFSRGLARDLGRRGITSNVILPGPIDTDANPADGQMAKYVLPLVPAERYGRADEVAALAVHVASEEAGFINGALLKIDGGLTA